MVYTLAELAVCINAKLIGDSTCVINNVAAINLANLGDITFLSNEKYTHTLAQCQGSAVILKEKHLPFCLTNALVVDNPHVAYAKIAAKFVDNDELTGYVHMTAVVDDTATVHATATISAHCFIGKNVTLGEGVMIGPGCSIGAGSYLDSGTRLFANVTLYHEVHIGKHVIIHSGAVIGSDGFGLAKDNDRWIKVPQFGKVRIGDEVEIGANSTVDRGALEDTVIETGVKIDNLVQIAHNVRIGEHTAIAGCAGVAGSTEIGKHCMIGGATSVAGHLKIPDHSHFTGMSMVAKANREAGLYSSGIPAEPNHQWRRNVARFRQIDKIEKRLKRVESLLEK